MVGFLWRDGFGWQLVFVVVVRMLELRAGVDGGSDESMRSLGCVRYVDLLVVVAQGR